MIYAELALHPRHERALGVAAHMASLVQRVPQRQNFALLAAVAVFYRATLLDPIAPAGLKTQLLKMRQQRRTAAPVQLTGAILASNRSQQQAVIILAQTQLRFGDVDLRQLGPAQGLGAAAYRLAGGVGGWGVRSWQ